MKIAFEGPPGPAIISIEVFLRAVSKLRFQRFSGFAVQHYFFNLLSSCDENVARTLHESGGVKPYSVSPLIGFRGAVYDSEVAPGDYSFNISLLNGDLKLALNAASLLMSERTIDLDAGRFIPLDLRLRVIPYESLVNWTLNDKFAIRFISPTCFKTEVTYVKRLSMEKPEYEVRLKNKTAYLPLPHPTPFLRNLLRIWKSFSNTPLPSPYTSLQEIIVEDKVFVYELPGPGLRTRWAREGSRKSQQGFIGEVVFGVEDGLDENDKKSLAALIKLGEYSGTGIMRTAGLGHYNIIGGVKNLSSQSLS